MLLDVSVLRLLGRDEFRVLRAVELGMRNHELVPVPLILALAKLRQSLTHHAVRELLKHKLLHHENVQYDGYRLTTAGYDFLAIHTLVCRGVIHGFGRRIGTGKESDVYEVTNAEGQVMVMKLHRLGRISFRAVKNKRDYLRHRRSFNWLYLSRLAAVGEYAFMKALFQRGFPVPEPIDQNRHVVLMSVVDGYPLSQVRELGHPEMVFETVVRWFEKFVEVGLVHCDFNEFNVMINDSEEITIIDFPQMVSIWHANAEELFNRDRQCILDFFDRRFHYEPEKEVPDFQSLLQRCTEKASEGAEYPLDQELRASGFKQSYRHILDQHAQGEDLDAAVGSDADSEPSISSDEGEKVEPDCTAAPQSAKGRQRATGLSKEKGVVHRVTLEQKKMMTKSMKSRLRKNTKKGNGSKSKRSLDF